MLENVETEGKRTIEPRGVWTLQSPCLPAGVMLKTRVYVWKLSPFLSDSRMRWATTFQGYSEPARQEMRACADFSRETCVRKDKASSAGRRLGEAQKRLRRTFEASLGSVMTVIWSVGPPARLYASNVASWPFLTSAGREQR